MAAPLILAETVTNNSSNSIETEAAADDNATVSSGEIFMNRVKAWLTFNQEKKVELELKLAELRLIQARIAARNNNTEAMQKALEAHEAILNRVQGRMERLSAKNVSSDRLIGLARAIQVHEVRITRLSSLLESVNLTDAQRARVEARLSNVGNVASKLRNIESRIRERRANSSEVEDDSNSEENRVEVEEDNDSREDVETEVETDESNNSLTESGNSSVEIIETQSGNNTPTNESVRNSSSI